MDPKKESKYIIRRFIEMWGYYADGWRFSCTWDGTHWILIAEHDDPADMGPTKVTGKIERDEWIDHHHNIVDEVVEQMYLDTFKPEARV